MTPGSAASACRTAWPRKTCVPGVHAYAGVGTSATRASPRTSARATSAGPRIAARSDAESLPLPADRLPEIVQLLFDDVADRLTRLVQVVADPLADLVHPGAVPHLLAALRGPARAFRAEHAG